ncbi:DUF1015 domain-containing protein [Vallicoccus soli]|uniref:DUF1015 domain-containing protein n=1 Tax=Vallicoccus soli TaxID=2339232 RepID=A0A3A3YR51_9ACTN|nr:DUF1015 domain-containing protein [Vallicoccus soli]
MPVGLDVRPFLGVRYDPARVHDLAAVTSPPYDVLDPPAVLAHELLEPHNAVRLVRPRQDGCGPEGPYARAAALLRRWLEEGVLRTDGEVLYAYEQGTRGEPGWQRGLLAAVGLGAPGRSAVVPHEQVMPGPVEDRLTLMDRTGANLEPILLLHEGDRGAGVVVEEALERAAAGPADLALHDAAGRAHRLWVLRDPAVHERLRDALHHRGALIADGHHRWAAYAALAERRREGGDGAGSAVAAGGAGGAGRAGRAGRASGDRGPEAGLALLVDPERYPLHLGAIHRTVRGLDAGTAAAATPPELAEVGPWRPLRGEDVPADALAVLVDPRRQAAAALRPGRGLAEHLARLLPGASTAYRGVPATALHHVLLPAWDVAEADVAYHHDVPSALDDAAAGAGTAVLLPPTTLDAVVAVVAAGETMPRKSTSFGPKPLTGLVLRLLAPRPLRDHAARSDR